MQQLNFNTHSREIYVFLPTRILFDKNLETYGECLVTDIYYETSTKMYTPF